MSKTQKKVEEEEEESGGAMAVVGHHPPLLLHLHLPCLTLLFLSFFSRLSSFDSFMVGVERRRRKLEKRRKKEEKRVFWVEGGRARE